MNQLKGLIYKEWRLYRVWLFVTLISSFITTFLGAYIISSNFNSRNIENLFLNAAMIFLACWVSISFVACMTQLWISLQKEKKHIDLWLHNSASIYTLVGAKIIYSIFYYLITTIVFSFIGSGLAMAAFDFSYRDVVGLQILLVLFLIALMIQSLFILFFFYTLTLQLNLYIKKFTIVIIPAIFIAFVTVFEKVTSSSLYAKIFMNGKIPTDWLIKYMPEFSYYPNAPSVIEIIPFYMVEEVVGWTLLTLLFILSIKWFEKVVTR